MPNLGMTKGLSFANNWDNDIARLYQREELASRVKAEKERKTQYYANLLKQGHATNPRAEKELTEYYKGLNKELADIVIQNPDLETNITAMEKFLSVSDRYINNDIIRTDKQVAGEFEKLRNAVSQQQLDEDEYEAEMERYNNYINSEPGTPVEPYVFTNYKKPTTQEIIEETLKIVGTTESEPVLNSKTGNWETTITAPENNLILQTTAQYAIPKNKKAIDKDFENYSKNPVVQNKYYGPNASLLWYQDRTRAAADLRKAQIGMDLQMKEALETNNGGQASAASAFAGLNKIESLVSMSESGNDDFVMPSVEYDSMFTTMGTSKTLSFVSSNQVVSQKTKEVIDLGTPGIQFVKTGQGKWVSIGGIPHLEVIGYVDNPIDSPTSESVKEALSKAGFDQKDYVKEGIFNDFTEQDKVTKVLRHTGTVLLPLKISPDAITSWTKANGATEKDRDLLQETMSMPFHQKRIYLYNKSGALIEKELSKEELGKVKLDDGSNLDSEEGRYYWSTKNGKKFLVDTKYGQFSDTYTL